ncbi:MAG: hypothetical protein Kow0069_08340 [Promethearchaeota archaeon]
MGDKIKCPRCGEKNKEKNKFCSECGAPLHGTEVEAPVSEVRPGVAPGTARRVARRTTRRVMKRVARRGRR